MVISRANVNSVKDLTFYSFAMWIFIESSTEVVWHVVHGTGGYFSRWLVDFQWNSLKAFTWQTPWKTCLKTEKFKLTITISCFELGKKQHTVGLKFYQRLIFWIGGEICIFWLLKVAIKSEFICNEQVILRPLRHECHLIHNNCPKI